MKRSFWIVAIIFFLLVNISRIQIYAQDATDDQTLSPTLSPVITMENTEIHYDLPYPGLLPDNPLYVLKVARDKIEEFFISDPMKKASFELQQADKRMNMSIALSQEKKVNDTLISSTVSKALNYLEEAITQTQQAKKQGQDTKSFTAHMNTASQKYHQLLLQLHTHASDTLRKDLQGDQTRLDSLHNVIEQMGKN